MKKGVFQYIANLIYSHIGNCKVITCELLMRKLTNHLNMVIDIVECNKQHILFKVDLCGDVMLYKAAINDRNCIEYVECIGEFNQ